MKKSRRQLLISSVSMLLVAILSLSVATYAWFTNTKIATAQGLSVRARRNSNILLALEADESANWTPELSLDTMKLDLKPVSTVDCENWYTTYADSYNTAANKTGGRSEIVKLTSEDYENYFVAKKFYVKYVGDEEAINASYVINAEGYPDYDDWENLKALRVALMIEGDEPTDPPYLSTVYSLDYAHNKGLYFNEETNDFATKSIRVSDYPTGKIKLEKDTPKEITLYAWYEGEDPDCIDTNSAVASIIDIAFSKASGGGVIS